MKLVTMMGASGLLATLGFLAPLWAQDEVQKKSPAASSAGSTPTPAK